MQELDKSQENKKNFENRKNKKIKSQVFFFYQIINFVRVSIQLIF